MTRAKGAFAKRWKNRLWSLPLAPGPRSLQQSALIKYARPERKGIGEGKLVRPRLVEAAERVKSRRAWLHVLHGHQGQANVVHCG